MKQKMLIFLALIFLGILLVGLNAATYVQKEKVPDSEYAPNRSTYNSGSTGSQAFYSLLSETGRKVRRWQSPLDTIDTDISERPSVFVMIGPLRRELTDVENTHLMRWVADGGTLVLIDREPMAELAVSTAQWKISIKPQTNPDIFSVDATNHAQMTADTAAVKPSFPSFFTHGVNAVQPSRFASSIDLERFKDLGDRTSESRPSRHRRRPSGLRRPRMISITRTPGRFRPKTQTKTIRIQGRMKPTKTKPTKPQAHFLLKHRSSTLAATGATSLSRLRSRPDASSSFPIRTSSRTPASVRWTTPDSR
jgi:hypothetical protein